MADGTYAESFPFRNLVKLFETLAVTRKVAKKRAMLTSFFSQWGDTRYFDVLRLILPQMDRDRPTYGMKEANLAKMYVKILSIDPSSQDANRLTHWRHPTSGGAGADAGDFASVVRVVLEPRSISRSTLSIADVNAALDALHAALTSAARIAVLRDLHRITTAADQKWIIRLILKDMKMHVSETTVLKYFHPDALEAYNVCSSLKQVAFEFADRNTRPVASAAAAITLFKPIMPMLAARCNAPEDAVAIMGSSPWVIESKYDGERLQVHYSADRIGLYSRKGKDYTGLYSSSLAPLLASALPPSGVDSLILDGEVVVWNEAKSNFAPFGGLKSVALRDVKAAIEAGTASQAVLDAYSENSASRHYARGGQPAYLNADGALDSLHVCFVIFDLLYLNGKSLISRSLTERLDVLHRAVNLTRIPNRLEIAPQTVGTSVADIDAALDEAMANQEEGIMVKSLASTWRAGERAREWLKIKPEYGDRQGDDLDCIIVGGYYGTGIRKSLISKFMLGVALPPANPGDKPSLFYSFCKVGTGYSVDRLKSLATRLAPHWVPYSTASPPPHLVLAGAHKEKPDVWIPPHKSLIMVVVCPQIIETSVFKSEYTIRFPRCRAFNLEKPWHQCLTLPELHALYALNRGRPLGALKRAAAADDTPSAAGSSSASRPAKRRKPSSRTRAPRTRPAVLARFAGIDASAVARVGALFDGLAFTVIGSDKGAGVAKADLESALAGQGATLFQNPKMDGSMFAVVARDRVLKVRNIIKADPEAVDVVHYQWVLDSVAAGARLPLEPRYMIHTTTRTAAAFAEQSDVYGDWYEVDATVASLATVFDQVSKAHPSLVTPSKPLTRSALASLDHRYSLHSRWSALRTANVYLDRFAVVSDPSTVFKLSPLDLLTVTIPYLGGGVADVLAADVTHVVVDRSDLSRLAAINDAMRALAAPMYIVDPDWVAACRAEGTHVDEQPYRVMGDARRGVVRARPK